MRAAIDRNRRGALGIGLAIVLFVALNIVAGSYLGNYRLDLTEDRLFTLSAGTAEVLQATRRADRSPPLLLTDPGRGRALLRLPCQAHP